MSLRYIIWAIDQKEIAPTARLVLIALADFAGVDGIAWPTVDFLGERLGLAPHVIEKALQELDDEGAIRPEVTSHGTVYNLRGGG